MKNSSTVDMLKWMDMTTKMLGEETTPEEEKAKEREKARAKLSSDLGKTNKDLMTMKVDKLNMLIKKKYYDAGKEIDEADMFQFSLKENSKGYEFQMPLNILFGRRTQAFCAQYWDDFFSQAGIDVSFADNIKQALDKAGNINLVMTISKDMEDEVDLIPGGDEEEEAGEEGDEEGASVNDVFDAASSDEEYVKDEFDVQESVNSKKKTINEGKQYTIELDVEGNKKEIDYFVSLAKKKYKLECKMIETEGPGGGWPMIHFTGSKFDLLDFFVYEYGGDEEDFEDFIVND